MVVVVCSVQAVCMCKADRSGASLVCVYVWSVHVDMSTNQLAPLHSH
jgi:hypothetical protein